MARRRKPLPPVSASIPFSDYLQIEALNWSSLKHLRSSPLHYRAAVDAPPEDRATLMMGRAAHTAILEPDRFPLDYAVFAGPRRAGAEWGAFEAANAGRTILKESEYSEALAVRDAVARHRPASKVLSRGRPEQTITWTDEATGIRCTGRIDLLQDDGLVDLKTTSSLDPRRFQRTFMDLGYHLQLAFYARGLRALGMQYPVCRMVAVESCPPHDVLAAEIDPAAIATGDEEISRLRSTLSVCRAKAKWPGRYPDLDRYDLQTWAYSQPDDESGNMGLVIGANDTQGIAT